MGLICMASARHRGTDKLFVAETQYSELEGYADLDLPVATTFPLRDQVLNTRLRSAFLDGIRRNLLSVNAAVCSWFRADRDLAAQTISVSGNWYYPVHYATEHAQDLAARILINEALGSFFGSYLRSKVTLTGVDADLFYDKNVRLAPLAFRAVMPVLELDQVYQEFNKFYQPDASVLELAGRVLSDERFTGDDHAARYSLCSGAVLLAYYLEGRA